MLAFNHSSFHHFVQESMKLCMPNYNDYKMVEWYSTCTCTCKHLNKVI